MLHIDRHHEASRYHRFQVDLFDVRDDDLTVAGLEHADGSSSATQSLERWYELRPLLDVFSGTDPLLGFGSIEGD